MKNKSINQIKIKIKSKLKHNHHRVHQIFSNLPFVLKGVIKTQQKVN